MAVANLVIEIFEVVCLVFVVVCLWLYGCDYAGNYSMFFLS